MPQKNVTHVILLFAQVHIVPYGIESIKSICLLKFLTIIPSTAYDFTVYVAMAGFGQVVCDSLASGDTDGCNLLCTPVVANPV